MIVQGVEFDFLPKSRAIELRDLFLRGEKAKGERMTELLSDLKMTLASRAFKSLRRRDSRPRCSFCKMRVRGQGHESGSHHKARTQS